MMKMLKNPATKYHSFKPINLTDRSWPSRTITHPPIWMSTDLRDGNQALFEPMNAQRKMRMFKTLVQIGVKQLAVNAARTMKRLVDATPETAFTLQYSPEVFSGTELEFAKEVCDAV